MNRNLQKFLPIGLVALLLATGGIVKRNVVPAADANAKAPLIFEQEVLAQTIPSVATRQITDADDGKTITVEEGTPIELRLKGNITTGYGWDVDTTAGTSVKQVGKRSYTNDPGGAAGRGGTFIFKFDTKAVGSTKVDLKYFRPFEKNKPPAKTFSVTIKVVPAQP